MAKFESFQQGTPSWIEHSSPDPQASREFYGRLFGWDYDDQPMGDDPSAGVYSVAMKEGDTVAGLGPQMGDMQGQPASWGVYLAADDVDAAAAKARDAGGQVVVEPMDIGQSGRIAWVQDPIGAMVGLWGSGPETPAVRANEHGTNVWNELVTADVAKAAPFYDAVFGLGAEQMQMEGAEQPYTTFTVDGKVVAGSMAPQAPETPPHWSVCFNVDDADAAAALARELGGQELAAPFDVPGIGRIAVLADPQGGMFSLMQNPPESA